MIKKQPLFCYGLVKLPAYFLLLSLWNVSLATTIDLQPGDYIPYDTDNGVGILYNTGAVSVAVTITDGGGAWDADSITIDLNNPGVVELRTNAPLTSYGASMYVITDSADCSLTLKTGVDDNDMDLTGDGAHLPENADLTSGTSLFGYFDAYLEPGTNSIPMANAAADETSGDIESNSDAGANLMGSIDLDNSTAFSKLTLLQVSNQGPGTDAGNFDGFLRVFSDVKDITIDGTASGGAWYIAGNAQDGVISVGSTHFITDIVIMGNLDSHIISTDGPFDGAIEVTGEISGDM